MTKKIKKKFKFRIIPFLIFLIVCTCLYFLVTFLINTKIKNIYIYNNTILSDQEIIELAKIDKYPSFYKTFSSTIKKSIKKAPFIKNVKIKKKFFNVLEIYIEEYNPLFINKTINKLILENGSSIELSSDINVPCLINNVNSEAYSILIKKMNLINKNIKDEISEIKYDPSEYDNTRFLIYMKDGNHVYVDEAKFINLNYYNDIYPTLNNKKGTLYLDSGNHFEIFKK